MMNDERSTAAPATTDAGAHHPPGRPAAGPAAPHPAATSRAPGPRAIGIVGAVWGGAGVFALLGFAVYRLAPKAVEAFRGGLTAGQWTLVALVCLFMGYAEGYRGFQKQFSPRTAARIRYLRDFPSAARTVLAPLFCMGYFHATRRTRIVAFALPVGIIVLVMLVHQLAQPWRGIIDAGVVLGLSWGMVSLAASIVQAFASPAGVASPEVPGFTGFPTR